VDASGPRARTSLPTGACLLGPDELLVCDTLNHKVGCCLSVVSESSSPCPFSSFLFTLPSCSFLSNLSNLSNLSLSLFPNFFSPYLSFAFIQVKIVRLDGMNNARTARLLGTGTLIQPLI